MKDKKIIILSIVGVLMLVSIVVATSYAYFVANVSGNKDTNNVVVTNGVMALEYKDGDEINLANAIPGSSVSKTFTVKNTGNVSTNYTIYFSELSNKFVDKTDLVYTLTSSDGGKNVAQTQVPSTNEAMVSNYAIEAGKALVLVVNKWDTVDNKDEEMKLWKKKIKDNFQFMPYVKVCFLSAKTRKRISTLMPLVLESYANATKEVKTSVINEIVLDAFIETPPPSYKGRRLKIYFAHQSGTKPPKFDIEVNSKGLIHFSYERYLENKIRSNIDFSGTPIILNFKNKGE